MNAERKRSYNWKHSCFRANLFCSFWAKNRSTTTKNLNTEIMHGLQKATDVANQSIYSWYCFIGRLPVHTHIRYSKNELRERCIITPGTIRLPGNKHVYPSQTGRPRLLTVFTTRPRGPTSSTGCTTRFSGACVSTLWEPTHLASSYFGIYSNINLYIKNIKI